MISRKELLKGSHLYAVVDSDLVGNKILKIARLALSAGIDMLQLRNKSSSLNEFLRKARTLKKIAKKYDVPFIINDRLDVALAVDSDGLHIGQGDIDISLAKKFMSKGKVIGVSVKDPKQALKAKRKGADYLGVGPVFSTPIKHVIRPKGFKLLDDVKKLNIPFYAIGGINSKNIRKLVKKGFINVAVIRAICAAKDPYRAVRELKEALA